MFSTYKYIIYNFYIIYMDIFSKPYKTFTAINQNKINNTDTLDAILQNILNNSFKSHQQTFIMLSGEPGTGKTSFIKQLCRLLGMDYIVLEVPHIIEEHLINIPFLEFNNETNTEVQKNLKFATENKKRQVNIVKAQSVLHQRLVNAIPRTDESLLRFIYHEAPRNYRLLWEYLGGNEETIPTKIKLIRKKYRIFLFIDEYLRKTSMNIRNILRDVLNGKLGDSDLPPHCYTIYATNIMDKGIDTLPANYELKELPHKIMDKDDWFNLIVDKINNENKIPLNQEVINFFYTFIEQHHLSSTEEGLFSDDANIRLSPRRWEEIIKYVNANIPCKTKDEADNLITAFANNFHDTINEIKHSFHDDIVEGLKTFIKHTSPNISDIDIRPTKDWKEILYHQIETKKKLGETRTYVPVLSGPPGIGKTFTLKEVAERLNMILVYISCQTITSDDSLTGKPIPNKIDKDTIITDFSEPAIISSIKNEISIQEKELRNKNIKINSNKDARYLVVFDEFNRVKPSIQNGLRRLILDKKLGDRIEDALPAGCIVLAAMNPIDHTNPHSVNSLSNHMKDVVDIIPSHLEWNKTLSIIKTNIDKSAKDNIYKQIFPDTPFDNSSNELYEVIENILNIFVTKFKRTKDLSKYNDIPKDVGNDDMEDYRHYYLNLHNTEVYFSPRQYIDFASDLASAFYMFYGSNTEKITQSTITEDEKTEIMDELGEIFAKEIDQHFLGNAISKYIKPSDYDTNKKLRGDNIVLARQIVNESNYRNLLFVKDGAENSLFGLLYTSIIDEHDESFIYSPDFYNMVEESRNGNGDHINSSIINLYETLFVEIFNAIKSGDYDNIVLQKLLVNNEVYVDKNGDIQHKESEHPITITQFILDQMVANIAFGAHQMGEKDDLEKKHKHLHEVYNKKDSENLTLDTDVIHDIINHSASKVFGEHGYPQLIANEVKKVLPSLQDIENAIEDGTIIEKLSKNENLFILHDHKHQFAGNIGVELDYRKFVPAISDISDEVYAKYCNMLGVPIAILTTFETEEFSYFTKELIETEFHSTPHFVHPDAPFDGGVGIDLDTIKHLIE